MSYEVALDRTHPKGRVVGVDIIPTQPPRGVSTIQGNFLSLTVQNELKKFLQAFSLRSVVDEDSAICVSDSGTQEGSDQLSEKDCVVRKPTDTRQAVIQRPERRTSTKEESRVEEMKVVDVVLSDMSEPWAQTEGFWKHSISDPYSRMKNTSGMSFRDHAGSMVRSNELRIDIQLTERFAGLV